MTKDYTSDDSNMYGMYMEGLEHLNTKYSTGMDQFTPKLKPRGNPEKRLSYASYFEEDSITPEIGDQMSYDETGEPVYIVHFDKKTMEAVIELPDETRLYNIPSTSLSELS